MRIALSRRQIAPFVAAIVAVAAAIAGIATQEG